MNSQIKSKWLRPYVSNEFESKIARSIKEAEKTCGIEFVPVIAERSSTVGHVFPLLGALMLLILIESFSFYIPSWSALNMVFYKVSTVIIVLCLARYFSRMPFFQRHLTSKWDQRSQVNNYAEIEFYEHSLYKVPSVLVYISLMEKRSVILLEESLNTHIEAEFLEEQLRTLNTNAKLKKIDLGIEQVMQNLSTYFKEKNLSIKQIENQRKDRVTLKKGI